MRSVLVLDSDPELRSFVSALLLRAGLHVRHSADVREAPALLRAERIDVLLTDLTLPHPRNAETLEAVRREFPTLEIIPVSSAPHAAICLRLVATLGGRRTPAQPFVNRELMSLVNEMLTGLAAHTAHANYRARRHSVA